LAEIDSFSVDSNKGSAAVSAHFGRGRTWFGHEIRSG
jgi:hypothetical protein